MSNQFETRLLSEGSNARRNFTCGNNKIDQYFWNTVSQDAKKNLTTCYTVYEKSSGRLAGFYTLSNDSIPTDELPKGLIKTRYLRIPATLIGRLACHVDFQGKQLGVTLLFDAIKKSAESPSASSVIFVDAIDEKAAGFYKKFGFISFTNHPLTLFLPMKTAKNLIGKK